MPSLKCDSREDVLRAVILPRHNVRDPLTSEFVPSGRPPTSNTDASRRYLVRQRQKRILAAAQELEAYWRIWFYERRVPIARTAIARMRRRGEHGYSIHSRKP